MVSGSFPMKVWTIMIQRNLMIPGIWWPQLFDGLWLSKINGDTSISDGLVSMTTTWLMAMLASLARRLPSEALFPISRRCCQDITPSTFHQVVVRGGIWDDTRNRVGGDQNYNSGFIWYCLSPLRELLHRRRGRSPEDEATRNEYLKPGEGRGASFVIIIISDWLS